MAYNPKIQLNFNVHGDPHDDIPIIVSDGGGSWPGVFELGNTRVVFLLPSKTPPAGWGGNLRWSNGDERLVIPVSPGAYEGGLLPLTPMEGITYPAGLPPLPPEAPTRDRICGVKTSGMQGLTVDLSIGRVGWFDPALVALSLEDRQRVYAAKKSAGDTHQIIEFMDGRILYDESGTYLQQLRSPDWEADPQAFRALVREVLAAGFTPIVVFDGDNADSAPYGHANAMRQVPILATLLKDEIPYVLFARFWDGVFYGSSPEHITSFGSWFRSYLPTGYLGIEHNTGHIPVGNGPADYIPGGMMWAYDVIFSEFDLNNLHQDSTWQVAGRLLRNYHRPPDQPANDDPNPPFYLVDSPRGPRYAVAFEYSTYYWVRDRITREQVEINRAYLKSLGYQYCC